VKGSGAEETPKGRNRLPVGGHIANCRILRKLGQGAMGIVYLAEQIGLERQVALKILDPRYANDTVYIDRFEREARASAALGHFNVVQVYDFGTEDGTYYIISEFVEGRTVQDELHEIGSFPCDQATDLVLQAARGLAAAEKAGVVHRDIKPENLMIHVDGVVKITDFGLAKVVKDDASVTQAGVIVGTPFYMSPEQARGETLDVRSDLYSLGITYFHMVTGQIPFDGDNVISVLMQHISGDRPNPSDVNPAVPRLIDKVILKMIEPDPADRFRSFADLVPVLEEVHERLRSGETGEEVAPALGGVDEERARRYKRLDPDLVSDLKQIGRAHV
jgi:eukaryotic-like serine/threonine-protein kinase